MAMYKCKKSNFTFDSSDISSVRLIESNKTLRLTYKDSTIAANGIDSIGGFNSIHEAKEAYEEIADALEQYGTNTRPFGTRG